jgi:putative ABC transport system substrate-binding protein
MGTDAFFSSRLSAIAAIAIKYMTPMVYWLPEFPAAGGLMSYGVDRVAAYRDVGRYVGRLLAGAKISDLPVLQPTRFSLVLNLKTAKAIGIEIPPKILALADKVIE